MMYRSWPFFMFICESCGTQQAANLSPTLKIVSSRVKTYPERFRTIPPKGHEKKPRHVKIDRGGEGQEIVREISVCERCAIA